MNYPVCEPGLKVWDLTPKSGPGTYENEFNRRDLVEAA
jgi:hypothetical protein